MFKMTKKAKVKTPDWILKGYDSPAEYNKAMQGTKSPTSSKQSSDSSIKGIKTEKKKGKTFKIRECPKCKSDGVQVVLGGAEGKGSEGWQCSKCGWRGKEIIEKELTEDEFMKYLNEKGEEVS